MAGMSYKYGKFSNGMPYRYTRGAPREYGCSQCGAWHGSALTVCHDCCRVNSAKAQAELLAKEKLRTLAHMPDKPAPF
jgi:predicted ATP-dependent serine protease